MAETVPATATGHTQIRCLPTGLYPPAT
jgi:hypothetical protein